VNRRKPHVQTSVVSYYPTPAPIDDFIFLFLPPYGPHLTPLATWSLESGLLVSPLIGGPARHRPFTPTLHLYQRKSSRNLHLQYSAKISPHHVFNHSSQQGATFHRSSDAPVLRAPQSCRLSPASKLLSAPGSRLHPSSLRSWFCGSTK
jgi:hypothetical protein